MAVPSLPASADAHGPDVVVNEIATRGPGGALDEFIEIRNVSDEAVDLSGWKIERCNNTGSGFVGTQVTVEEGTTLAPGDFYLAANDDYTGDATPDAYFSVGIADNGGARIVDTYNTVIDGVGFGTNANNCTQGEPASALSASDGFDGLAATRDPDSTWTGDNATDFSLAPRSPGAAVAEDDGDPDEPEVCEADTFIHEINIVGDNGLPNTAMWNQQVSVEGVVTANFLDGLDGVFLQEEDVDTDDDPTTSEGIFVYLPTTDDDALSVGDLVCVSGTVRAFAGTYQLTNVEYDVVASGTELPTAVEVVMPVEDRTELAQVAGMLVDLVSADDTFTITQNYFLGQYGELDLSAAGFLWHPSELYDPDSDAAAQLREDNRNAMIKLDDANSSQNVTPTPWLDNGDVRAGSVTTSDTIQGIVHYQFSAFRIQPTEPDEIEFVNLDNPRPDGPPNVLAGADEDAETTTIAAFNVLNYFTTLGSRGADTPEEFELQAAKIVTAITEMDADVVGLMEIENNFGDSGDALQDLVERLNMATATGTYAGVELKEPVGTDAISNAMIYQPERVTPVGELALADHEAFMNPLGANTDRNRPAIAQAFMTETGDVFVAVVNHLKAKGSGCGEVDPEHPIAGNCNLTRTLAAEELVRWLEEDDPSGTGSDQIIVLGDLNAYAMEDPIEVLRAGGYVDALRDETPTYTYTFDGEHGRLDHMFVSGELVDNVVDAQVWHINTDEPAAFDYNDWNNPADQDESEFRSSDHDPVLLGLQFWDEDDGKEDKRKAAGCHENRPDRPARPDHPRGKDRPAQPERPNCPV